MSEPAPIQGLSLERLLQAMLNEVAGGRARMTFDAPGSPPVVLMAAAEVAQLEQVAGVTKHAQLTQRERELLILLAEGTTQAAAANRLDLSISTINQHLRAARSKLGVGTTAEAIAALARSPQRAVG